MGKGTSLALPGQWGQLGISALRLEKRSRQRRAGAWGEVSSARLRHF